MMDWGSPVSAQPTQAEPSEVPSVHVQGVPLCSAYPAGTSDVRVPVLFEMDMAEPMAVERTHFELCILLDRSGSMSGQKLRSAKEAVHSIIDALAEGDVLHLVAYDRWAETVLQGATWEHAAEAHEAVSGIMAQGATNISAAIQRAQELLNGSEDGNRGKRIFLLSDGDPTAGLCNTEGLKDLAAEVRDGGVVISAFGIGQDFNEEVMTGIAQSGRGSYFFLRESIIRRTIEDALSSLQRTVGVSATIHVESLPPHGVLSRIFRPLATNGEHEDEIEASAEDVIQQPAECIDARIGTVWVGDLQAGGHKQQLIEAHLSLPRGASNDDEVVFLRYELHYHCPSSGDEVVIPGKVAVTVGSSDIQAPQVQVADVIQQLHPRQEEFSRLVEDGDRHGAMALQRQVIQELEEVEALDTRGYAVAQIRRLRRVLDRVERNVVSSTQARLMVGEALHRSSSGDLDWLNSPPGTPPASTPTRLPLWQHDSGGFNQFSLEPPMLFRQTMSPPISPRSLGASSLAYDSPMLLRQTASPPTSPRSPASYESPPLTPRSPGTQTPTLLRETVGAPSSQICWPVRALLQAVTQRPRLQLISPTSRPQAPSQHAVRAALKLSPPLHLLADSCNRESLPSELFCSITREVMTDPVVAQDGHTYERSAIELWFTGSRCISPKTGEEMPGTAVIPNHAMRAQIMTENERHSVSAGHTDQQHRSMPR